MKALILTGAILPPLKGINAYLDPGSGSLILQVILAAALGGLLLLKTSWKKIKNGVKRLFAGRQEVEDEMDEPK